MFKINICKNKDQNKNKNKNIKNKTRINIFKINKSLSFLFLSLFLIIGISAIYINDIYAFSGDKSEFISNLSDDEIENIFEFNSDDIAQPWAWIADTQNYIIHQKDSDGSECYWWNVPNLQSSAFNSLYSFVANSGYDSSYGILAEESSNLVNVGSRDSANTAMKKYGFHIPSPTYLGERPLITISITDVIKPDGILNGIARIKDATLSFFTEGHIDIVKYPTDEDLETLLYVSPRDYENGNKSFQEWVRRHWSEALEKIPKGAVLSNDGDEKTGESPDGKYYVWSVILESEDGVLKDPSLDAKEICQKLKEICGNKYGEVALNIVRIGKEEGIKSDNKPVRQMPYDIDRLNAKDKNIIGPSDPRSDMQQTLLATGLDKKLYNFGKSIILSISGNIAELSIALNGVTNFSFIENAGFSPTILWDNTILKLLVTIASLAFVVKCVMSAFTIIKGNGGQLKVAIKLASTFLVLSLLIGFCTNTDSLYNSIKDVSSKIFNLSNMALENNENLTALYGTGDGADKENTTIWLPYFNNWTKYNTNHSLLDDNQIIEVDNEKQPETLELKVPEIDNVKQDLWSTILADTFTNNEHYNNKIYRVVDHFMAPRLNRSFDFDTYVEKNKKGEKYKINGKIFTTNENYNGNIQSSFDVSTIPLQLIILFFIILKIFIFFEFIFNLALLFVNLCLTIVDLSKMKKTIQELVGSLCDVVIINLLTTLIVWISLVVSGIPGFLIACFLIYATYAGVKYVANSSSMFTPKIFHIAGDKINKFKNMFEAH